MQGLSAGGRSNDTLSPSLTPEAGRLRTIARAESKKRKESGRSAFAEQGVVRPWVKGVGI